jgi:membrane protease YdiL (CAAX protease family)
VLIVATSLVAAVSEELIVNAYLLRRLQQIGWGSNVALLASVLLRGTYHLYQGVGGFVANVVGGAIAGRIFQRTGRVMPLVVAHFVFDLTVTAGYLALHGRVPGLA